MRFAHLILVPCLLAPAVAQEDMMAPAAELAKLDRMIGTFTGAGKTWMAPDVEPMEWTATSTVEKVLGGHFLHTTTRIKGASMPTPLEMQGVMGYDREAGRYVGAGFGNDGHGNLHEMYWVDDDTLVTHASTLENGTPVLQRETVWLDDDGYEFKIERAIGAGKLFTYVEGNMKKSGAPRGGGTDAVDAAFMNLPPSDKMTKLIRCAGSWNVKGEMVPMPGMPAVPVTGQDRMKAMYGGHVLVSKVKGDPTPPLNHAYEMIGFTTWNPSENCYVQVYCDNMGAIAKSEGRWDGDHAIVFTGAGTLMGKPTVGRMILHVDDSGNITKVTSDMLHGTMEPEENFDAKYEPAKDK